MNKKSEKVENKAETKKVESKKVSSFSKKKKVKKNITSGIAYVYSTFSNTIISIADESGNVVSWSSAGAKGFKGSRNNIIGLPTKKLADMLKFISTCKKGCKKSNSKTQK